MKKNTILTILLLSIVVLLAALPLFLLSDAEFAGADEKAEAEILKIDQDYEPWFDSLFTPASGEVESFIFTAQAALGAGVLGFGLGYLKGKKKRDED